MVEGCDPRDHGVAEGGQSVVGRLVTVIGGAAPAGQRQRGCRWASKSCITSARAPRPAVEGKNRSHGTRGHGRNVSRASVTFHN